jgi:chromosome segregation ATPase
MLDSWWAGLAQRLRTQLALPGVPEELGGAFAQVWAQALLAGQAHAEGLVAPERAALAAVVTQADAEVAVAHERVTALESRLAQAEAATKEQYHAWIVSDQQVGHLGRQVAALEAQRQDLTVRRDALEARLLDTQRQAEAERVATAAERDALQAHLRQVEERAYTEVDRTRQELKALKAQLATQAREHAAALRTSEQARRTADAALAKAGRDNASLQVKLEQAQAKRSATPARKSSRSRKA